MHEIFKNNKKLFLLLCLIFFLIFSKAVAQSNTTKIEIILDNYCELIVADLETSEKFYLERFNLTPEPMEENLHKVKRYLKSADGKWLILTWGRTKEVNSNYQNNVHLKVITTNQGLQNVKGILKDLFPKITEINNQTNKQIYLNDLDGYVIQLSSIN